MPTRLKEKKKGQLSIFHFLVNGVTIFLNSRLDRPKIGRSALCWKGGDFCRELFHAPGCRSFCRINFILFLNEQDNKLTLTQVVFIFAFLVVGPLYGFAALRLSSWARTSRWTTPKYSSVYDFYIVVAVAFAVLSAYVGWLLAGLQAMETYPQYPSESPGEAIALLYTIPGFITGLLAVGLTYIIGKRLNLVVLVLLVITLMTLMLLLLFFGFFGLLFPGQD